MELPQTRKPNSGAFKKGNIPWNAGTKGQRLTTANKGSFKKGNRPLQTREVGSERNTKRDGILVKVAHPNKWLPRSHVIYMQHHGLSKIPQNFVVWHKNGDNYDDRIDNLLLVSRGEMAVLARMKWHSLPPELKETALLTVKLRIKKRALINDNRHFT